MFLKAIEGASVMLRLKRGRYSQASVYTCGPSLLMAKVGATCVVLRADGGTSDPDVAWEMATGFAAYREDNIVGRLHYAGGQTVSGVLEPGKGAFPLAQTIEGKTETCAAFLPPSSSQSD